MSDKLRLFATTDVIYPNIKEVSSDDILADSGTTTGDFIVTVPANTLTANITPLSGITYTHYVITVDDSDTPTFPADFTQGVVPLTKNLADWASEVWRLSVYDLPTTTQTEITAPAGTSGVTVTPKDTLIDIGVSDLVIAAGANAPTQLTYDFNTGTDNGTGIYQYDLMSSELSGGPGSSLTNIVIASDITRNSETTVSSLTPLDIDGNAVTLDLWVRITDVAGNVSTSVQSNIDSITLGTPPAITDVTVTDSTNGSTNLTMSITDDASIDEWFVQVNNSVRPIAADTNWTAVEPTSVQVTTLGTHNIYVWGRDATYPTGISATASDTAIASNPGVTTEAGFADNISSVFERYAPTHEVVVERSGLVSGVVSTIRITSEDSTDNGVINAIDGVNYRGVNEVLTFASTETSKTVKIPIYYTDLGHSNAGFDLVLSDKTNINTVTIDRMQVTIRGNAGYWDTGDIDVTSESSLPANLQSVGMQNVSSNGTTVEFLDIDASGQAYGIIVQSGVDNTTIENCIIRGCTDEGIHCTRTDGITIRNCYFTDTHQSGNDNHGYNVRFDGGGSTDTQDTEVLGCNGDGGSGFIRFDECDDTANINIKNNFYQNGIRTNSQGQLLFIAYCDGLISPEIYNNISLKDHSIVTSIGRNSGGDHFNTFRSGCDVSNPGTWKYNYAYGHNMDSTSATGLLMGDNSTSLGDGNNTVMHNTMDSPGVTCYSLMGGQNQKFKYNDGYSPYNVSWNELHETEVGVNMTRSRECPIGSFQTATFAYGRLLYYKASSPAINNFWNPPYGVNGDSPNHGTTSTETNITGFEPTNTTVIMSDTSNQWGENWDSAVPLTGVSQGDNWVGGRFQALTQPAIDEGIRIWYFSYNCPIGDGILTYDQSANTITFAAYGEIANAAVSLASQEYGDSDNDAWHVYSDSSAYIRIIADVTTLQASTSKTWTVKNSGKTFRDIPIYPGVTGDWTGSGGVTPPSGDEPTIPTITDPITVVSETALTIAWSASSGTPAIGGYNVYRDGQLANTTTGLSFADTGLTTAVTYSYQVEAFDTATPVRFSGLSNPLSATTDSPGNEELLNAEMTADSTGDETTGWHEGSYSATSPIISVGGALEVVNAGTSSASLYQEVTGLSNGPGTTYKLTVGHKKGANNKTGRVYVDSTPGRGFSEGDIISGSNLALSNNSTFTEYEFTGLETSTTEMHITLWTFSNVEAGDSTIWDYCRLEEE